MGEIHICECGTPTKAGPVCVKCQEEPTNERQEQVKVIKWLHGRGIEPIRIANERSRKRKWDVSIGTADLFIMEYPEISGVKRGVFVEMKQTKKWVQSEAQKAFADKCKHNGYLYLLCKGYDDAVKQLTLLGF